MTTQSEYHSQSIPRGEPEYVMSQSSLKLFAENPWAWIRGKSVTPSSSMEWGNLVDCLYLTPERFASTYKIRPAYYPSPTKSNPEQMKPWNANSKTCKAILKEISDSGLIPLLERRPAGSGKGVHVNFSDARDAVAVLKSDEDAERTFSDTVRQRICEWSYKDSATGITVPLKCMIDAASENHGYLADLKTTSSAHPEKFRKHGADFRYDLQAAFYAWGHRECYSDKPHFVFLAQDNTKPYACASFELSPDDYKSGREGAKKWGRNFRGYEDILKLYCWCLKTGFWPGYTPDTLTGFRFID